MWAFNVNLSLIIFQFKFLGYSPDSLKQFISRPVVISLTSSPVYSLIYPLMSRCTFLHVMCYVSVFLQAFSSSWNAFPISFHKSNFYLMKYMGKEHRTSRQTNLSSDINSGIYTEIWVEKVFKTLQVFKMWVLYLFDLVAARNKCHNVCTVPWEGI